MFPQLVKMFRFIHPFPILILILGEHAIFYLSAFNLSIQIFNLSIPFKTKNCLLSQRQKFRHALWFFFP